MTRCASSILVSCVCSSALLLGCTEYGWQEPEELDLGVSADLYAVSDVGWTGWSTSVSYLAVGAQGTVVAFGDQGDRWVSKQMTVGDQNLYAVTSAHGAWYVVGAGGFAASSEDHGLTWAELELGTTSDLHAIVDYGSFYAEPGSMIIVGDEVVFLRHPDGSWQEQPAPEGGWGRLRDARPGYGTYLVGLGGVAWYNNDPYEPASLWEEADTHTNADLLEMTKENFEGVDEFWTFTSDGTVLHYAGGPSWVGIDLDERIEIVDFDNWKALAADGTVYEFDHYPEGRLDPLPYEFPRARAFATARHSDYMAFVGAGGFVGTAHFIAYYGP